MLKVEYGKDDSISLSNGSVSIKYPLLKSLILEIPKMSPLFLTAKVNDMKS